MAKYLVETYYTCTFKVNHYLDNINDDEIKNTRAREEFTSLFASLPYKAPEILLGYYDKIRKILATTIPIDPDDSKNPQWKKNIVQKWTESCIELDEKLLPKVKQAKIP